MKIAYLSFSTFPSREANSIQTIRMCSAFSKNGCDVALYCIEDKKNNSSLSKIYDFYGVDNSFQVVRIYSKYYPIRKDLLNGRVLFQEAKKIEPDLIYSRSLNASYFAALNSIPHIFESHVPPENVNKIIHYPSQEDLLKRIIKSKSLKKMVVISNALKEYYCERYSQIKEIIDVQPDSANEIISFNEKVELPGRQDALKVGYVGQLYKGKGAEIIPLLADKLPDYDFHIVGGTENDIEQFKKLTNNNLFIHGFVKPFNTYKYLNSFDVLIAPYQKEIYVSGGYNKFMSYYMSPLKVFEYMAAKKPIIASNLPVLREFLNEQNSILVEPDNINEWINALKKLEDYEIRNYIAYNAFNLFKDKYTWEKRAFNILSDIANKLSK